MEFIKSLGMMFVIGALLGAVLGFASKAFYVKEDTRVKDILALLPGYNCGGCGNPGCSGMAEKIVSGESDVSMCKPSKPEAREAIKKYLEEHPEA